MFIIPYVETTTEINNIHITIYHVLMIGGTRLWKEDTATATATDIEDHILRPNDIYLSLRPHITELYALCRVDTTKTQMEDYYTWEEMSADDEETFCWRTFYMIDKKWLSVTDESDITILFNAIRLSHLNPTRDI